MFWHRSYLRKALEGFELFTYIHYLELSPAAPLQPFETLRQPLEATSLVTFWRQHSMPYTDTRSQRDPQAFPFRQLTVLGELDSKHSILPSTNDDSNMSNMRANSFHVDISIHLLHDRILSSHR